MPRVPLKLRYKILGAYLLDLEPNAVLFGAAGGRAFDDRATYIFASGVKPRIPS